MSRDFQDRVRKAMQQPASGEHPSADVLNAYTEKALPAAESQQVLQHLSACAECREVVFLAAQAVEVPEEEPVYAAVAASSAPAVTKRRVRWFTWAVPLTAVLVVASVLLLEPNRFLSHRKTAEIAVYSEQHQTAAPAESRKESAEPPATAPAKPATPPSTLPPAKRRDTAKDQRAEGTLFDKNSAALKQGPLQAENKNAPSPGTLANPSQRTVLRAVPSPARAAPATADALDKDLANSVEVAGESSAVQVEAAQAAKTEPSNPALATTLSKQQRIAAMVRAKKTAETPQWRITSNGELEHLVSSNWQPAASPSTNLLAVASFGSEVWTSAKGLALYHSGDNGAHWERLTLPAEIAGEIPEIAFSSALDGLLTTSSGDRWATHDGGKTWAKMTPSP